MISFMRFFHFIILVVICTAAAFAQIQWESMGGPAKCNVNAIAAGPGGEVYVLFNVGSERHLYRSRDNGISWQKVTSTTVPMVARLLCDENGTVYFWSHDGVHVSSDLGTTWTVSQAIFPATDRIAAGGGIVAAANDTLVEYSPDGGVSWLALKTDVSPGNKALGLTLTSTGGVYLCTEAGGLRFSDDLGATWKQRTRPGSGAILQMFVDDAGSLFVQDANRTLHRSGDGGMTWTSTGIQNIGTSRLVNAVGGLLYAIEDGGDIVVTSDGGTNWSKLPALPEAKILLHTIATGAQGYVYIGTAYGVYVFDGVSWSRTFDKADSYIDIRTITPLSKDLLLMDSYYGWFLYNVPEKRWSHTITPLEEYAGHHVGTDGSVFISGRTGLYHVSDDGQTWERLGQPQESPLVTNFLMDSKGTMFFQGNRVWTSTDTGKTWHSLDRAHGLTDGTIDPMDNIVVPDRDELHLSTDAGVTWTTKSLNITLYSKVYFAPDGTAFAAGVDLADFHPKIFRSNDYFTTWQASPFINTVTISDMAWTKSGVMCISAYFYPHNDFFPGGFFVSYDGGVTFHEANNGFPGEDQYELNCRDVYIDENDFIYLAYSDGLYRTAQPVVGVQSVAGPSGFSLSAPYPHPVSREAGATITFALPGRGYIDIALYDMSGRRGATIALGEYAPGEHTTSIGTAGLNPGAYVCRYYYNGKSKSRIFLVR